MSSYRLLLTFCVLAPVLAYGTRRLSLRGRIFGPPKPEEDAFLPPDMWLDQQLDHFDHTNFNTWRQRYFVNDTHWKRPDGPVFLLIGGEGPNNPAWLSANTEIMLNAQLYNALVLSLEHRFYGKSHPTVDLSVEYLRYLSSQQALADLAYFHDFIVSKYNLTDNNKWISFGGSYSGNLAAWFRMKYTHLVVGAVASSAPVQAVLDFTQYLEVVSASLATSKEGSACVSAVKEANFQLTQLTSSNTTWYIVEKLFQISPPLSSRLDVQNLAQSLAGNFMDVVQYNNDNKAFEGPVLPETIESLCEIMTDTTIGDAIERYSEVNRRFLTFANQSSMDVSYDSYISAMQNTSWDGPASDGGRQWVFQTCSQFAYFQTTDSFNQPFGSLFPLKFFLQQCLDIYGPQFTPETIEGAVEWTNTYYGAREIASSATNIVFPNGSIDPWHALGITSTTSKTVEAIFINGTAHCANMYPPRDSDLEELKDARIKITTLISVWLKEA